MFVPPSGFDIPNLYIVVLLWILTAISLVSTVQGFIKKQPDLFYGIVITLILGVAAFVLPIFNTSGKITIAYYGIILMSGAVCGGVLAYYELKRRNYDPELVWDLLVYLIIGVILGWGILLAVKGNWWFLVAGVLAYLIAFSKIGCLPKSNH